MFTALLLLQLLRGCLWLSDWLLVLLMHAFDFSCGLLVADIVEQLLKHFGLERDLLHDLVCVWVLMNRNLDRRNSLDLLLKLLRLLRLLLSLPTYHHIGLVLRRHQLLEQVQGTVKLINILSCTRLLLLLPTSHLMIHIIVLHIL